MDVAHVVFPVGFSIQAFLPMTLKVSPCLGALFVVKVTT
jgi:hypothetical protein